MNSAATELGRLTITYQDDHVDYIWGGSSEALDWAASHTQLLSEMQDVPPHIGAATVTVSRRNDFPLDLSYVEHHTDGIDSFDGLVHLERYARSINHRPPPDYVLVMGVYRVEVTDDDYTVGAWEGSEAGYVCAIEAAKTVIGKAPDDLDFEVEPKPGYLVAGYDPKRDEMVLDSSGMDLVEACLVCVYLEELGDEWAASSNNCPAKESYEH